MAGSLGGSATPPTDEQKPDLETAVRNLGRTVHSEVRSTLNPTAEKFGAAVKPNLPGKVGMKKIFMWLVVAAVMMAIIGIALG